MKDEKAGWDYKSDADDNSKPDKDLSAAVDDELKKPTRGSTGELSWSASEYIDHKQGPLWFIGLSVITLIVAGLIYLITRDYFATVITIMLGIVVGTFAKRTPKERQYNLSAEALTIDEKAYPLSIFKSFSIIQDGALLSLELLPVKRFMPPVSVYFSPADQEKIVEIIEDHLPYEERRLEAVERLTRRLKF